MKKKESDSGSISITIQPLQEADLSEARRIFHLAFGTFLGLPDPMQFWPDRDYIRTRYFMDPKGAFAAVVNGELAGSNFAANWGSIGFFGPLTIHPDLWNKGIGKRLLEPILDLFSQRGHTHTGLFTFAHSPKHIGLYQKFGYWPRYLTAIMTKELKTPAANGEWKPLSELGPGERLACLREIRNLCHSVYEGLDLEVEIRAVEEQHLGETILIYKGSKLCGFAVCHYGPNTEGGQETCYIKFGLVQPGPDGAKQFDRLLDACEAYAESKGVNRIEVGVNLARHEAYQQVLNRGYQTIIQGVAMQRPNESAYNRGGVYLIDDWR